MKNNNLHKAIARGGCRWEDRPLPSDPPLPPQDKYDIIALAQGYLGVALMTLWGCLAI